jgi:hypothetical protein
MLSRHRAILAPVPNPENGLRPEERRPHIATLRSAVVRRSAHDTNRRDHNPRQFTFLLPLALMLDEGPPDLQYPLIPKFCQVVSKNSTNYAIVVQCVTSSEKWEDISRGLDSFKGATRHHGVIVRSECYLAPGSERGFTRYAEPCGRSNSRREGGLGWRAKQY